MFRTLIYPSSGACDCVDELPHRSSCSQFIVRWSFWCGWFLVVFVLQAEACKAENKTTDVVIHQHSCKLLKMDILTSETCWAHNKWNKIASDINLVFHSSTNLNVFYANHIGCVVFWSMYSFITRELGSWGQILMTYGCMLAFFLCCAVLYRERNYDGQWWPQTCTNKIYTPANWESLGCTGLWAPLNGMVYILKLEYHYRINLKYVVYLPVLKVVDNDKHHWQKLFKCTSTVCNVMLVHFTRSTLLFVFTAEFC